MRDVFAGNTVGHVISKLDVHGGVLSGGSRRSLKKPGKTSLPDPARCLATALPRCTVMRGNVIVPRPKQVTDVSHNALP